MAAEMGMEGAFAAPVPQPAPVLGPPTITDFKTSWADDPASFVSLTDIRTSGSRQMVVSGMLTGQGEPGPITTGPINDWVIEYSATPAVWVCTQDGKWFRLGNPSADYERVYTNVQRKFDLCVRAATVISTMGDATLQQALPIITRPVHNVGGRGVYNMADIRAEAGFLAGQLSAYGMAHNQRPRPAMVVDLARLAVPQIYVADEPGNAAADSEEVKQLVAAGLLAPPANGQPPGATALRAAQYAARFVQLDLERGLPPLACSDWRVDSSMVADLLSVWHLCMTFGNLLQLPPISLDALQAAVLPAPVSRQRPAPAPVAAPPGGLAASSVPADGDSSSGSAANAARREDERKGAAGADQEYDLRCILDPDAGASAVLLRDIHAALLKAIDGFNTKKIHDQPAAAKLNPDDAKAELWQERTYVTISDQRNPPELIAPGAKEGVEVIRRGGEYYLMTPRQRVAVLRTLADLALQGDVLREHIAQKYGAHGITASNLLSADAGDSVEHLAQLMNPGYAAGEAEDPETWVKWVDTLKLGVRGLLGHDTRRRSYFVLASRAGAWRIFVQGAEGNGWGWYEGADVQPLIEWLQSGKHDVEQGLLKALQSMPMPRKYTAEPVPGAPLPLSPPEGAAGLPSILFTPADLKARRPDGYKLLAAPMLKGEYHQHIPSGLRGWTVDDRLANCVEAVATEFDFWAKQAAWITRISKMLQSLKAKGVTAGAQAQAIHDLEAVLHEGNRLRPEWGGSLRDVWLRSLQRPNITSKDVAMHAAALQTFIKEDAHCVTRLAFVRQAQVHRCPLYFPAPGDTVVFLRSGCMIHLDKYCNMGSHYAVEDMHGVRDRISTLRPVERLRVIACGYRSYPVTNQEAANQALADNIKNSEEAVGPTSMKPTGPSNPNRPPCMWILAHPLTPDAMTIDESRPEVALPIHIDNAMPDYVVRHEQFERGMAKKWAPGDRIRMFFGGKMGTKAAGSWYKGTVRDLVITQGRPGDPHYDPWDSLIVSWDIDQKTTRVNPWEIELDPEEAKKREEERRKAEEAAARAQRAAAKSRRGAVRLREIIDDDYSGSEPSEEEDSDDSYEGSAPRKRGRPKKKPNTNQRASGGQRGSGGAGGGHQRQQPAHQHAQQPQQNMAHMQQMQAMAQQQQQQQMALMQQLGRLQQAGQGNSPLAQQVIMALQNIQNAQRQMQAGGGNMHAMGQQRPQGMQQMQQGARPGMQNQAGMTQQQQQQMMLLQQQQQMQRQGMTPQQQQQMLQHQQMLMQQQQMRMQQQQQGGW